jgi:hypothetical protein
LAEHLHLDLAAGSPLDEWSSCCPAGSDHVRPVSPSGDAGFGQGYDLTKILDFYKIVVTIITMTKIIININDLVELHRIASRLEKYVEDNGPMGERTPFASEAKHLRAIADRCVVETLCG